MFAICGKRPVFEALNSKRPYKFKSLCIAQERVRDAEINAILKLANQKSIPLTKTDSRELDRYAPGHFNHQGLVLLLKEPPWDTPLDEILKMAQEEPIFHILALDSVLYHQNIGSLVRTAVAFGFKAILSQEERSAPLIHPTIWRLSQGAAEHIHFIRVANLSQALKEFQENGFWTVGTIADERGQDIRSVKDWPQ